MDLGCRQLVREPDFDLTQFEIADSYHTVDDIPRDGDKLCAVTPRAFFDPKVRVPVSTASISKKLAQCGDLWSFLRKSAIYEAYDESACLRFVSQQSLPVAVKWELECSTIGPASWK